MFYRFFIAIAIAVCSLLVSPFVSSSHAKPSNGDANPIVIDFGDGNVEAVLEIDLNQLDADSLSGIMPSSGEGTIEEETDIPVDDVVYDTSTNAEISHSLLEFVETLITPVSDALGAVLFYPVHIPFTQDVAFPFLVLWMLVGGIYFTARLGLVNIRMFSHAIQAVRGKYSSPKDPGDVTHAQALFAAVSATVGLGNIAGVAIAVAMGGPGAVVWMAIAGFLGMSTKFAEVTLGQKYRKFDENGRVSGGAFHYLEDGLSDIGLKQLGKILAIVFAVFCIGGSLGGGNMFQSNQTVAILKEIDGLSDMAWLLSLVLAVAVGTVLIGGIRRIAHVAEAVVPLMAFVYISAAIAILFVHRDTLGDAVIYMFHDAFSGSAVGGGLVGALIAGVRRSVFSNEAGLGSAPIAHSAAKTKEPVREGCVALLEPFIDTIVICFITGLVITVTGVYTDVSVADSGVLMTSKAFATVIDWFPMVLSVAVALFAFSTMITWSYYGERAWRYLFGAKYTNLFHVIFVTFTFIGGVAELGVVIDLSDLLMLAMALPNLIGLYLLSGMVVKELASYQKKLKAGKFKVRG